MEETLVYDKFSGPDNAVFLCHMIAHMVDEEADKVTIHLNIINVETEAVLADVYVVGKVRNPLDFEGAVLAAVGYYGFCVGTGIAGAAVKVLSAGYRRSRETERELSPPQHLFRAFGFLLEKRHEIGDETAKAFVTCAAKMIPTI